MTVGYPMRSLQDRADENVRGGNFNRLMLSTGHMLISPKPRPTPPPLLSSDEQSD